MVKILFNRVLVKPDEVLKEHKVEGTDISLALAMPGDMAKRYEASVQHGHIVDIGPIAYTDMGITEDQRPKVGDHVLWAKYAGVGVIDPETEEKLVILNDEDILCVLFKEKV